MSGMLCVGGMYIFNIINGSFAITFETTHATGAELVSFTGGLKLGVLPGCKN